MSQRDFDATTSLSDHHPRPYNGTNVSGKAAFHSRPMPMTTPDPGDLSHLIKNAAFLRLRLRNVDPNDNKFFPSDHGDFWTEGSPSWTDAEKRFYAHISQIQTLILNANNVKTIAETLPLEALFTLLALWLIVLDNRNLVTNATLPDDSPYRQDVNSPKWNRLNQRWHILRDFTGRKLEPLVKKWITSPWIISKAQQKYPTVTLQTEDISYAIPSVWVYLSLSLQGKPTPKGKDCVFNPHFQQKHGDKATLRGWLGKRLEGAVLTVAKKKMQQQLHQKPVCLDAKTGEEIDSLEKADTRSSRPWWDVIQDAIPQFAEELENLKPRSEKLHHINARMVILSQLPPPQNWKDLAQQWECNRTTLERFYKDKCIPWIREHCPELKDLL